MIVGQENNAETRQGNLIAQEETLQQQIVFAQEVEAAKIVEKATAVKASAHSRSSSVADRRADRAAAGCCGCDRRRRPHRPRDA